jgi:hypothetical protein
MSPNSRENEDDAPFDQTRISRIVEHFELDKVFFCRAPRMSGSDLGTIPTSWNRTLMCSLEAVLTRSGFVWTNFYVDLSEHIASGVRYVSRPDFPFSAGNIFSAASISLEK